MTKRLHPEIKGMRALVRAVNLIPPEARHRCLSWLVAQQAGRSYVSLPPFRSVPVEKEKP